MQRIGPGRSRRVGMTLAATALGVLGFAGAANAATFAVNDTRDLPLGSGQTTSCVSTAGTCTLRAAVQAADNDPAGGPDTITLPAGTYKLTIPSTAADDPSNGDLDVNNNGFNTAITIDGAGSGSTVINAAGIDRAFAVQTNGGLTLSGLTIENGYPSDNSTDAYYYGGGIYTDGALTTTSDVVFSGDSSDEYGGAIYADSDSTVSLTGATFDGDSTWDYGGAIYDDSSNLMTISKSTFTGDVSDDEEGGAIYGGGGGVTVDQSSFSGNSSDDGGAIYWDTGTDLTVTNSAFTNNSAYSGGAIEDDDSGKTTLTGDRFVSNSAGYGGALYLESGDAQYTINHDEFDNNNSPYDGGAIYLYYGDLSSDGSSFVGNDASDDGGAIFSYDYYGSGTPYTFELTNATISKNSASEGGGIYFDEDVAGTLTNDTIAFNSAESGEGGGIAWPDYVYTSYDGATGTGFTNDIVADNGGGDCADEFNGSADTGNNLDSDGSCIGGVGGPGDQPNTDPKLAQPADNGGPVLTDRELTGSPAIDAGTNTGAPATDARGVTRPQGASTDIGAFEYAAAALTVTASAPSSATQNVPFNDTITVRNGGPGYSTGTTITESIPAGETLYGSSPSQGTCTQSGATVTCALGNIASGSSATVTLVLADANTGAVTNTATAANDENASVSASATTDVSSATPAGTKPTATTGSASNLTTKSAVVHGSLTAGGQRTAYFFELGTSKSYGRVTSLHYVSSNASVHASLGSLKAGTTYHYRLVAVNDSGNAYGKDRTFKTKGTATNGKLVLDGSKLKVKGGKLYAKFSCDSTAACVFRISVNVHAKVAKTKKTATVLFLQSKTTLKRVGAHKTATVTAAVTPAGLALLKKEGHLTGKLSTRPRTAQKGIIQIVSIS